MNTKVTSPSFPALPYVVSNNISDEQFREVQDILRKALEDDSLAEVKTNNMQ